MATLKKQVWLRQLVENFYPATDFLKFAQDFTKDVNNDKLNFAAAGVDPVVLINNTTYPINVTERADLPIEIELDLFETENTLIRSPDDIERSTSQLESVLMGHRNSLRTRTAQKAAHAYAPQAHSSTSPVLVTTGTDDGEGNKRLTVEDIFRLKRYYDNMNYPTDKRVLVLHPRHTEDLVLYDLKSFKDITDFADGKPKRFAGFNMLEFPMNAVYNRTTLAKKSFAAVAAGTDGFSSFSFYGTEVMKADGNVKMYTAVDDPKERATIVGFDKRFIAVPFRNKGIGSIVSAAAS